MCRKMIALFLALALSACSAAALADVEEGLFRTAVNCDITTMDVALTSDDYMVPMNVFDRLFETRPSPEGAVVEKSLATDYKVSDDGLTYEFTLLEGVKFSNGNPLTASDVKFTFERLLKKADMNTDIPEEVAGGPEMLEGKADSLEGFTVKDDTHFSITLRAPNAGFLAELSSPGMSIVDEESVTAAGSFGTGPADTIGSGPYKVTEWETNDHFTLEYNPAYRGQEPSVKKAIISIVKEAAVQDAKFQMGDMDLIDLKNLDSRIVEKSYTNNPLYADRIVRVPAVGLTMMVLNQNNEFLKNQKVRQAIAQAIDMDQIIQGIYGGEAQQEKGIIPTGVQGYNPDLKGFTYDPEGAKALLKEAGYTEGQVTFEMSLDEENAPPNIKNVYNAVWGMLNAVGIRTEIKNYDHSGWLEKRKSGTMDSFIATWLMDYNDPANIMNTFFGGEEQVKMRSLNYPDKEIIARVAKAPSITDHDAWIAEYRDLEKKIIKEDVAWVPLFEYNHLFCLGERVESFTPQWAGFSNFYLTDVVLK